MHKHLQKALPWILLLLPFPVFFAVTDFGYTNWDDPFQVILNPGVINPSIESIKGFFQNPVAGSYQPLASIMFMGEIWLRGLDPGFSHLINLCIHALNVFLVFQILKKIHIEPFVAFFLAAVFAVHPIQAEAISWISARSTLLSVMLVLCSTLMFIKHIEKGKRWPLAAALFLFLAACFTKVSVISFNAIFLLLPLTQKKQINKNHLLKVLPFVILSLIFLIVALQMRKELGPNSAFAPAMNQFGVMILAIYSILFYFIKSVWPFGHSALYEYPAAGPEWFHYTGAFMLVVVIVCIIIYRKRINSLGWIAMAIFIIPLSVHLKFTSFGMQMAADRYAYLSVPGAWLLIYWFLSQIKTMARLKTKAALLLTIPLLLFISWRGHESALRWKNTETLWTSVLLNNAANVTALYNRAQFYVEKGKLEDALKDLNNLLISKPEFVDAYIMKGDILAGFEDYAGAIDQFTSALSFRPDDPSIIFRRGSARLSANQVFAAGEDFLRYTKMVPDDAMGFFKLALCYISGNRPENEILDLLNKVIQLDPEFGEAYYFRAILEMKDAPDEALKDLRKAISLGIEDARKPLMQLLSQIEI